MKDNLLKTFDDIKLYYRFACKKLGIPAYEVHQIYLPKQSLIYIPIPKNACTSIKHALYEIEFGKRFSAEFRDSNGYEDHHDYYKKRPRAFTSVSKLESMTQVRRFALVRDPVKRLISCYRNRVLDLGDLEESRNVLEEMKLSVEPDINTFILNLKEYRKYNHLIEHHSRPQYNFLGGTINYLDEVFPMEEISSLKKMLREYKPDLEMLQRKSGGTSVGLMDLTEEALEYAINFYHQDYKLLSDFYSSQIVRKNYQEVVS